MTHRAPIAGHEEVGPHPGTPAWSPALSSTPGATPVLCCHQWLASMCHQAVPENRNCLTLFGVFPVPQDSADQ